MTQQVINVGAAPNDGTGNTIRQSFTICNSNFSELYSRAQVSPPATLVGTVGDFAGMYAYDSTYFYYCYDNYDGSSQIWAQVTQIGNVSLTNITNGNSSVAIAGPGGNVAISSAGVSNVAVITSTGATVTGRLSTVGNIAATGNVTASYFLGNGSQLTGLPDAYGNSNVALYLPTYTGNLSANNITTTDTISANGNITTSGYFVGDFFGNITGNFVVPGANTQVIFNTNGNADAAAGLTFNPTGNILTVLGPVSATGNITGGNVRTGGLVSATGNITGSYIIGNGSQLTGLPAGYANSDVAAYLSSGTVSSNILTTNAISATGNITGSYIIGNGSQLTGLPAGYANSDVAAYLSSGTVSANLLTTGLISATGNVTGGNVTTGGIISTTGNITGGNVTTGGLISATGNITGGNISATNHTGTTVSVTSNITGGNVTTGGLISATGNITGGNISATNHTGTTVSVTGVITGASVVGGVMTGTSLSVSGNVQGGNLRTVGVASVTGNVTANNFIGNSVVASTGNLNLTAGNGSATQINGGGTFRLPSFTTLQLANITGVPGDLVYNTTDNKVQAWQHNATSSFAWVSLSVSTYQ
jgi:hypothetical protein